MDYDDNYAYDDYDDDRARNDDYYDRDHDDDYDDYSPYSETWRDRLRMAVWRFRWFIRENFKRCQECHHRYKDCTCGLSDIPF